MESKILSFSNKKSPNFQKPITRSDTKSSEIQRRVNPNSSLTLKKKAMVDHDQVSKVINSAVNDHRKSKTQTRSRNPVIMKLKDNDNCVSRKRGRNSVDTQKQDAIWEGELNKNPKFKGSRKEGDLNKNPKFKNSKKEVLGQSHTKKTNPLKGFPLFKTEIGECSISKPRKIAEKVHPMGVIFSCEICADSKSQYQSFNIKGCPHFYCCDCVKDYIVSKLQDGISQINCPVPKCPGVLEQEYCQEILPSEVFSQWGNLLCESVILESQKFYCPFKDCSALMINDGGKVVTNAECQSCHRMFCAQCKVGWHSGIGCAEYQSLNKDERQKEDIMFRKLAKNKNWQRCPKCKFYVEKSQGCHYMKCRCGVAFCYNCGSICKEHLYHYCEHCRR